MGVPRAPYYPRGLRCDAARRGEQSPCSHITIQDNGFLCKLKAVYRGCLGPRRG